MAGYLDYKAELCELDGNTVSALRLVAENKTSKRVKFPHRFVLIN